MCVLAHSGGVRLSRLYLSAIAIFCGLAGCQKQGAKCQNEGVDSLLSCKRFEPIIIEIMNRFGLQEFSHNTLAIDEFW
jgi:hypothetical protein